MLPVAIVFDLPEKLCQERNRGPTGSHFGPHVVRKHMQQLRDHCAGSNARASATSYVLSVARGSRGGDHRAPAALEQRRSEHGPFDIIGDVHGCFDELRRCW